MGSRRGSSPISPIFKMFYNDVKNRHEPNLDKFGRVVVEQ